MINIRASYRSFSLLLLGVTILIAGSSAQAQEELTYVQYRNLSRAAIRMDHMAQSS